MRRSSFKLCGLHLLPLFCHQFPFETPTDANPNVWSFFLTLLPFNPFKCLVARNALYSLKLWMIDGSFSVASASKNWEEHGIPWCPRHDDVCHSTFVKALFTPRVPLPLLLNLTPVMVFQRNDHEGRGEERKPGHLLRNSPWFSIHPKQSWFLSSERKLTNLNSEGCRSVRTHRSQHLAGGSTRTGPLYMWLSAHKFYCFSSQLMWGANWGGMESWSSEWQRSASCRGDTTDEWKMSKGEIQRPIRATLPHIETLGHSFIHTLYYINCINKYILYK